MEEFLSGLEYKILQKGKEDIKYTGMEYDSRKIEAGNIFVALEGAVVDGHKFIKNAVENGAKAILVSKEVPLEFPVEYILVKDLRKNLGKIASEFYNYPQKKLKIIGITGTNGKTTSTYLLESILGEEKVARIGTVEYKIGDEVIEAQNTTPESLDIVKICKKAVDKGLEYLVMEVSSHALALGRVSMLEFDVASFTNLTLDHLDYHESMQNYFEAKRKLFTMLKVKENSVINIDDPYGEKLYKEFGGYSYSLKNESANLKGKILEFHSDGQLVELELLDKKYIVKLAILGRYNLYNVLGVIGMALLLGKEADEVVSGLKELKGAPGRFELINCGQDYIVVVDYAHTGDALENILQSINELKKGRVITVFGCGGDRDPSKRPIMGEIAQRLSDIAILTSDNPRTEDPHKIIEDVLKGMDGNNYLVEENRELAIVKAIEIAKTNDIILIAGKGHEAYQILGRKKIHFDDREIARREIVKRKMRG
ncbi:UDP-N-acetylmuramoyl-L-alanyl-D-glutamate--2,6-diaminopimelate ligase [uncultured Fusobacterium sp.]|uniref:UDP-N-acetylmuramoyl-L-alanyl-D-glutamate--2, 6-diaminopimelate ligase n=1 Tax=uncultured Fusobacterium sp. TaxID=159267 RepID=UPI0025E385BC|nr:UDP-N-acetylmuramoyl-L-alanyl-D-glutamate--2,6-diaminopimelate ligase [uncultured Fusobacterium sp.]